MKNLGEKLSAARNAMGLTIRDAADSTRLRIDIITNMEAGEFSFSLPEIYKRGFLRIYASFLKLNVDEILAEFEALQSVRKASEPRGKKNILERISPVAKNEFETPQSMESRYDVPADEVEETPAADYSKYFKLGAVFLGVLLVVILIILGVSSLVRPNVPEANPDIQMSATQPAQIANEPAKPQKEYSLVVSALRDTYITVFFPQDYNNHLYSGAIAAGEKKEFKYKTPININTSDAQNIELFRNGKKLDLSQGTGKPPMGIRTITVLAKD